MERIIYLGSRYPESVRFRGTGAGRSGIPYLALHPMGFSVPRRLRFARCALAAPFHPCRFEISNLTFEISKWRFNFLWHCPSESFSTFRPRISQSIRTWVTRHRALWCSDFPLPARAGSDSPPFQNQWKDNRFGKNRKRGKLSNSTKKQGHWNMQGTGNFPKSFN